MHNLRQDQEYFFTFQYQQLNYNKTSCSIAKE